MTASGRCFTMRSVASAVFTTAAIELMALALDERLHHVAHERVVVAQHELHDGKYSPPAHRVRTIVGAGPCRSRRRSAAALDRRRRVQAKGERAALDR